MRGEHGRRQQVMQVVDAAVQRLAYQAAQPGLLHALRRRVHRRQVLFERRGCCVCEQPVFRVNNFKSVRTLAHLAIGPQPLAARESLLLGFGKIEKAQRQQPGAVADAAQQAAATAKDCFGKFHVGLDNGAPADAAGCQSARSASGLHSAAAARTAGHRA